jgi:hypothetical protein
LRWMPCLLFQFYLSGASCPMSHLPRLSGASSGEVGAYHARTQRVVFADISKPYEHRAGSVRRQTLGLDLATSYVGGVAPMCSTRSLAPTEPNNAALVERG